MATLRSLLPLEPAELAGVATAVAAVLAELHATGVVHGSVSADHVFIDEGRVTLSAPATDRDADASPLVDVSALGRMVTAALVATGDRARHDRGTTTLAEVAASARRAVLAGSPSAAQLAHDFADAVPAPRIPSGRPALQPAGDRASPWRPILVLGAWIAMLVATVVLLPQLRPDLGGPPILDGVVALRAWLDGHSPADAAAAVLRVVVLVLAWYLLATTALGIATRALATAGSTGARVASMLVLPQIRRLVHAAFGATLTAGAFAATASASADPAPVVMRQTATADDVVMYQLDRDGGTVVTMRRLEPEATAPEPTAAAVEREWQVQVGDHLWAVAESVLAQAWGRQPLDAEIDPYWRAVVEANRDRLADRANPDLVFPGQRLRVPPPPAAPAARSS